MMEKKKRLFRACVLFSLFCHALMLYLFQAHSIWFASPPAFKQIASSEKAERSYILKEAFQTLSHALDPPVLQPQKIEAEEDLQHHFAFQNIEAPEAALQLFLPSPSFNPSDLLSWNSTLPNHLTPPAVSLHPFSVDASLAALELPPPELPLPPVMPARQPELLSLNASHSSPPSETPAASPIVYEESGLIRTPLLANATVRQKASLAIPPPPLPSFPLLSELDTYSYSDSFELDIVCSPREDGKGYLFAATLIPYSDLHLPPIRQHYSFLIDRANSIQRERLLATKSAVLRALDELDPDDTFNIFVFDSKIEKVFGENQTPTPNALAEAKAFLDKIQLGSFFTPADLYNPLLLTLPYPAKEDEVYTTILITDGDTLTKKNSMRSIMHTWTMQNNGKTSLFTLGMGSDLNLSSLDAVSALNRGHLYISPTKRGVKRKLLKLMKNIHAPIAKNLSAKAIRAGSAISLELFPKGSNIPHLYLDQPIVILGSSNTLDDFILFVQGRCKNCWFNIKKNVSFINAKKGGNSLRKEWALQQAYRCYELYSKDDNPDHLVEARELLAPFDIQPAFE